ncbi:MAG: putative LPS assembly protein LptD [Bacteroidota bacterium]
MKTNRRENKAIDFLLQLCFFPLLFITPNLGAQVNKNPPNKPALTNTYRSDTTRTVQGDTMRNNLRRERLSDSLQIKDSVFNVVDTLDIPVSADSLDAPVRYEASDSGVLMITEKKFLLYGAANTKYQTLDLSAGVIELDNGNNTAKAYFTKDSTGKVISRPKLVDGDMESEFDSLFYNMKTQKGLSKSTYTKQGEMFVHAERIKKFTSNEYYASAGRFTTCNLDTPHFAFRAQKIKLVNNKWAYSGLVYPEFENVPIPIGLPFGIFPLSQGRHSGLIAPTFSTTENFGIGLTGLGYYKVLNEHFDAVFRADLYSYGGFNLSLAPTYRKRYKYNGAMRLNFQNTRINFKGDPDFVNTKTFNVGWSHSMDSKARPGTTFSANVNFGSTRYNQFVANNPMLNFTNQVNSSIQYSKSSLDGKTNLSVTANHSQNNQTGQYNISLPVVTYTVNTIYPLQKKETVGTPKWYEKLGIGYNGQAQNQFSFFDRDSATAELRRIKYNIGEIIDTMQWAAQHSIPITLSLPTLGPFQISPGISYQERWYGQQVLREWNEKNKKVDTITQKGFYTAREMSFSLSTSTAIFGTLNFKKAKNIQAIRHVIRPTMGLSYKPDMASKYFYNAQVDSTGRTYRFSKFDGSLLGPFSEGRFGGLNFGLQNNLEMKVRDKNDTTAGATKKIKLIDNFSLNSAYNLIADSFKLSPISVLLSTTLFEKMNVTASTVIDPYQLNERGDRIDRYTWQGGDKFSLGRITNGSLSFGTSFQSKKKEEDKDAKLEEEADFTTPEEQQRELDYIRSNPAEFADFNVPWTLNLSYSLSFSRQLKPDYSGYRTLIYSSLNLSGDFNFSPKWKMGGNIYYDFNTWKLQNVSMFISREMHCWQMAINITPVGYYRSFNISISPKSGILRDLKINRTRSFYE